MHLDGETEVFGEGKFVQISKGGNGGFSGDERFGQLYKSVSINQKSKRKEDIRLGLVEEKPSQSLRQAR